MICKYCQQKGCKRLNCECDCHKPIKSAIEEVYEKYKKYDDRIGTCMISHNLAAELACALWQAIKKDLGR